jgi:hypothetical protein
MGASELLVPEWTFWGWAMAYSIEEHPDESTSKFLREKPALSEIWKEITCQFIGMQANLAAIIAGATADDVIRDSAFNTVTPLAGFRWRSTRQHAR